MLGVEPLIKNMERLLMERKINTGTIDTEALSLVPLDLEERRIS